MNVFDAAVERMTTLYAEGHRIVVSFSGGKDSGVCLEICIIAARATGRLPVEAVFRDDEIDWPGVAEYCARTRERAEVDFHWLIANQPVVNVFNRINPYYWAYDKMLDPSEWVRQPPPYAEYITDLNIRHMIVPDRFPPPEGKRLVAVLGLRAQESNRRMMGISNSKGHLTLHSQAGAYYSRPIYDWLSKDIWKATLDNGWDYARCYDLMLKMGIAPERLRVAPPSLSIHGVKQLQMASKAWPQWWGKVCERLPGLRAVAQFGDRSITAQRKIGETWEQCYVRTCVIEAPKWISERASRVKEVVEKRHAGHASTPIPESTPCRHCTGAAVSWRRLTRIMFLGDPLSVATDYLGIPDVDPEVFRPGSGVWYPKARESKK